jgi:hypothetical protein
MIKVCWWYGIKRDVTEYVALCDTFQRVKTEHQRPARMLQLLQVPEWKWKEITTDFIVRLPRTRSGYNFLWVIVDRLTKVAHFRPVKMTYTGSQLAELYMPRIVCFYEIPIRIVSNRETQVISMFWERLHETLDTHWNFSSAYHPRPIDNWESKLDPKDMLSLCSAVQKKLG